jgi:Dyp-type peroxidase family
MTDATTTTAEDQEASRKNIQAHLLKASKFKGGRTRNWSLFVFFRIMADAEMQATWARLPGSSQADAGSETKPIDPSPASKPESEKQTIRASWKALKLDMRNPALVDARLRQATTAGGESPDQKSNAGASPAKAQSVDAAPKAFLNWLKVLVEGDGQCFRLAARDLFVNNGAFVAEQMGLDPGAVTADAVAGIDDSHAGHGLRGLAARLAARPFRMDHHGALMFLQALKGLETSAGYATLMHEAAEGLRAAAKQDEFGPALPILLLHEILRQGAPAFRNLDDGSGPIIRSEERERDRRPAEERTDSTPITLAFTHSGLEALGLDQTTLASFPDPFKEGMAARARRLGDTGPSAPDHWDGELGLKSVHGFFTGGFATTGFGFTERFWKQLRAEVRDFNDARDADGADLRLKIGLLFRALGLEIVHIELGQEPEQAAEDEAAEQGKPPPPGGRREHFGFRDGLSQPFIDMGLSPTLPGGGTPSRRGSWEPVAPGEIFLDLPDEDGEKHGLPINTGLRRGSTFLVLRKLEQDVPALRAFLDHQRPDDKRAQTALAAQMVGRWPKGAPLVRSPHYDAEPDALGEAALNDFRYAADDPDGARCPLGAHIRRANPRDIGGRNEARRHRILRRGISYGGPLLPETSAGDDERRGMLFIALNARIDLQFEVIQADWINGGEYLGQAGLGKCPLTGANNGGLRDSFLEVGAAAPVTGLPRFVITRGGDYFFAPGIDALRQIADGERFDVSTQKLPFSGYSMNDTQTPSLFSERRIRGFLNEVFGGKRRVLRLQLPGTKEFVSFVGRHEDVVRVLKNNSQGRGVSFSIAPYRDASRGIMRGRDLPIGTEHGDEARSILPRILDDAWVTLRGAHGESPGTPYSGGQTSMFVRKIAQTRLDAALRRISGSRRIDLIADFAAPAAYGILTDLFGTPGPGWLTELGAALPFARQHVGDLPPDWLAALKGELPNDPGLTTMQVWSSVLVADLIGNVQTQKALQMLSRQAGSELLNHIDPILQAAQSAAAARATGQSRDQKEPKTLVWAFAENAKREYLNALYGDKDTSRHRTRYYQDVSAILLEIIGSTLAVVPLTFASVMQMLMQSRIDLSALLPELTSAGPERIIYEAERLNPNMPIRMRRCTRSTHFFSAEESEESAIARGDTAQKDDTVAAVVKIANLDPAAFAHPERFSLNGVGISAGPERLAENYLLFGVPRTPGIVDEGLQSQKYCWGADRVAMPVLEECVKAAGRLQGLRRVAGEGGEPRKMAGVTISLPARFSRVLSHAPQPRADNASGQSARS